MLPRVRTSWAYVCPECGTSVEAWTEWKINTDSGIHIQPEIETDQLVSDVVGHFIAESHPVKSDKIGKSTSDQVHAQVSWQLDTANLILATLTARSKT